MNDQESAEDYWDSETLAAKLQVSEATLSRMRQTGTGPAYFMVGKQARYRSQSVEAWIRAQEKLTGAA